MSIQHRHTLGPLNILVVDDDESVRSILVLGLERAGYAVDTANDGVEGLEKLRTAKYDLLISDYQMPRLNGLELVKRLRSERMTLPVILVSGFLQMKDLADLDNPRPTFLLKPFSLSELLARVQTVLDAGDTNRGSQGS